MGKLLKHAGLLLRYLDLVQQVDAVWQRLRDTPSGRTATIGVIKTRLNGRRVEIGPTPVRFLD